VLKIEIWICGLYVPMDDLVIPYITGPLVLVKAASASVVRPSNWRATPFLFQAFALCYTRLLHIVGRSRLPY
jgi:hypothetical protein